MNLHVDKLTIPSCFDLSLVENRQLTMVEKIKMRNVYDKNDNRLLTHFDQENPR